MKVKAAYLFDVETFPNVFMVTFREVKTRLDHTFWIYDIGTHQANDMLKIVSFVSNTLLIGFNNKNYDNPMVNFLCKNYAVLHGYPPAALCRVLFKESQKIIESSYNENKYDLTFRSCDLMAIGTIKRSLKLIGVKLKHEWLQELPYRFDEKIKTIDQLKMIKKYNLNDIDITEKLYYKLRNDVKERLKIEDQEGIEVLDVTRSSIANMLTIKMYQELTGLDKSSFINLRTYRKSVKIKDCISPIITYRSKHLNDFLNSIKKLEISSNVKGDFRQEITINKTTYTIAKGGIHDAMKNTIRIAKDGYIIKDADVGSYYPRIIQHFDAFPEHLDNRVKQGYIKLIDERIAVKKTNPVKADLYKIILNSFYGKYGSDTFFLYDPKAMYQVTLNGQLSLIMLIEELEHNGIEVFSANTDGITAYFHKDLEPVYDKICKDWEEYTKLNLEYSYYDEIYMRNANNYFVIKDKKIYKEKGYFSTGFDPMQGFDKPIIPDAIKEYFLNRIPVRQTIEEHKDILDFTTCQNKDKKFHYLYKFIVNGEYKEERFDQALRYYASKGGGLLVKTEGKKNKKGKFEEEAMIANQNVTLINDVTAPYPLENPIDYDYYVKQAIAVINDLIRPIVESNEKVKSAKNQITLYG